MKTWFAACAVLGIALGVSADSITIDSAIYSDVYVMEGANQYYVKTPKDGQLLCVSKERVDPKSVHISADPAERDALEQAWRQQKARSASATTTTYLAPPTTIPGAPKTAAPAPVKPEAKARGARPAPTVVDRSSGNTARAIEVQENGTKRLVIRGDAESFNSQRMVARQQLQQRQAERQQEQAALAQRGPTLPPSEYYEEGYFEPGFEPYFEPYLFDDGYEYELPLDDYYFYEE